jgi:hypothetical protein
MFSEMVRELEEGKVPAAAPLRQRFDMAMTKKMGIVRLPAAFWMADPKINPPAGHLFWASLLLLDRPRIELALAVLAAEGVERDRSFVPTTEAMAGKARGMLQGLLAAIADEQVRENFRRQLQRVVPEWLDEGRCCCVEDFGNGH